MLLLLPFASCVSKSEADRTVNEKDSLALVVAQKDSVIEEVFAAMNVVAENLGAIKSRENIINDRIDSGEVQKQTVTRINEDIEAINRLLVQNRETIARLEQSAAQLKKANVKIAGLEKLIAQLNRQVEEKDQEIEVLKAGLQQAKTQVAELHTRVGELNTRVSELNEEKVSLEGEVRSKTDMLNTGYYIVGAEKELLRQEIVYKSGFIGRTLKINENRSLDSFTQINIPDFDSVVVGHKKAVLVSSHPEGSYRFEADGKGVFGSLVITDPELFWKYSKVLVISYK